MKTKTQFSKLVRFLSVLCLAVWAAGPRASAQTPGELCIQLYAGLTITAAVGTVYSVEYVTDLALTNSASAWRCHHETATEVQRTAPARKGPGSRADMKSPFKGWLSRVIGFQELSEGGMNCILAGTSGVVLDLALKGHAP